MKRAICLTLLAITACLCLSGCSVLALINRETGVTTEVPNPAVTITMMDDSVIELELYPSIAPNTVANFVTLAESGFYDGLYFHRVIPGFMIQGGDPTGTGTGGPGYTIKGEFAKNNYSRNALSHTRGVISMARGQSDYNSAGSQFFIMHADADYLDGEYAAFGKVTSGMDIVDAIANINRDATDKPLMLESCTMATVTVDTFGFQYQVVKREE